MKPACILAAVVLLSGCSSNAAPAAAGPVPVQTTPPVAAKPAPAPAPAPAPKAALVTVYGPIVDAAGDVAYGDTATSAGPFTVVTAAGKTLQNENRAQFVALTPAK